MIYVPVVCRIAQEPDGSRRAVDKSEVKYFSFRIGYNADFFNCAEQSEEGVFFSVDLEYARFLRLSQISQTEYLCVESVFCCCIHQLFGHCLGTKVEVVVDLA